MGFLASLFLFLGLGAGGDELAELKTRLVNSEKWVRQGAVEKLADLGTQDAWELVLGALADPAGEVADTAQWELGRAREPEVVESLLDREGLRAKEALVRERAAEALGRLPVALEPGDQKALVRALDDPEARVRRALAAGIAARGAGGFSTPPYELLDVLERMVPRERDGLAQGHGLLALAALDAGRAREVWAGLDPRRASAAVRCAAARSAEELGLGSADLLGLAQGAEPALGIEVAVALGELATAESARALVELLAAGPSDAVARRCVGALRELSGLHYGPDPRPWRDWAERLPAGVLAAPAAAARWGVGSEEATRSELIGLPILSERLTLLIDLSGSMWMDRGDGKTRKELAEGELAQCLAGLPETTHFNIIAFTREPIPWKDGLQPASERNRAGARDWFADLNDQGSGNFFDAFLLALADPEVETVVLLGDGEPTGGARYHLELLPSLIDLENLGRGVVIDSILAGTKSKRTKDAWAEIARRTGGRSIVVEL
jgi:HEAT repeat protein